MMTNKYFSLVVWVIPFIMGFMTLGMNSTKEGTDLVGQVYTLSNVVYDNPLDLLLDSSYKHHGLYYAVYACINMIFSIEPMSFIAFVAFAYYLVFVFLLNKRVQNNNDYFLCNRDYTRIALISICSFSPIYICITRNLFAVTIILLALFFFEKKKLILGSLFTLFAYVSHEGMLLIMALIVVGFSLNKFVLHRFSNIKKRNFFISIVCVMLYFTGPVLFSFIGGYAMDNNITSEKYNDLYITTSAGDGVYKYVIILSMLGSLYALVVASFKNVSNDIVNSICISGLFFVCIMFNQKLFLVQRLMMFLPLFIGLSLFDVFESKRIHFSNKNWESVVLLSVPAILFAQLFFWRNTFFSL